MLKTGLLAGRNLKNVRRVDLKARRVGFRDRNNRNKPPFCRNDEI